MDTYQRHQLAWRCILHIIRLPLILRFNMTREDLHIDGPVLLIPNHVTSWDPLLVSMSLKDKQVYYVASEHIFRLGPVSKLIEYLVAPIPRRKASSGTDTVKACLRHLRDGHSVCLFAEGEQSWDGNSIPVFPATGKLAKVSGATLVTYRLEGGYLSLPRWAKKISRGRIFGHPVGIYPPELLAGMSAEEITALINRDIDEDAWERQRSNPVLIRGKHRAEGMERALYACPGCRRIGTLHTRGDCIFCDCGFSLRYTESCFFSPETPFSSIADWDRWQRELLHTREFVHEGCLLFSDGGIELKYIGSDRQETVLETGVLLQYEDRLVCGVYSFPLAEIQNMALVRTHLLFFSFRDQYYQLRTGSGANLRKYLEIWKENS